MVLVLGCPGAGCTTFLKSVANERGGYVRISGDVRYAGIDAIEMAKMYKGEVVYNQEGKLANPLTGCGLTNYRYRRHPYRYIDRRTDIRLRAVHENTWPQWSSPWYLEEGLQRRG